MRKCWIYSWLFLYPLLLCGQSSADEALEAPIGLIDSTATVAPVDTTSSVLESLEIKSSVDEWEPSSTEGFELKLSLEPPTKIREEQKRRKKRYFAINTLPLLSNLVPFNSGSNDLLLRPDIYFISQKENRMIRFGFGFRTIDSQFVGISFSLGRVKDFSLNERFSYFRGFDITLQGSDSFFDESVALRDGFGFQYNLGLRYKIHKNFFLSTESSLRIIANPDRGIGLNLVPPIDIYLQIRFR